MLIVENDKPHIKNNRDKSRKGLFFQSNRSNDNNKSWSNKVTSENLYASYLIWCDSQKIAWKINQNGVGRYLTKIFGQSRKLKGDARGYVFGPLIETISKFEKYEKVDLGLKSDDFPLNFDKFEASNNESISSEFNFGMIAERVAPLRVIR